MLLFLHSLVIYVTNFILVLSLRPVLRRFLSKDVYPYCAEVLGSFLMVANVHENGNVYGQYGMGLYSACLFALMMVYAGVADSLTNPISVFDQWWNKKVSTADAILKIMSQVIGALLAARYMKWLWKTIALSEYQVSRANFLSLTCDSANKVTLLEAMAVELLAASTLRIFASFSIGGPLFQKYVNAAATILVILAGSSQCSSPTIMLPFVVFLAVCLLNSVLALVLKKACQVLLPQKYYPFASEFCCTFIVVANVFENGNMIESYGLSVFAVTLFLLILIYMNLFDAFANPVSTFDLVWNKKKPLWDGVFTIICQVAGGCLGGKFIVVIWGYLQLTSQHISKYEFLSQTCHSTNQVTLWQGILVEMGFTVVIRIVASFVSGAKWERTINSFASVLVVVIGLEWTGSMINPALATAMTYNCQDHPFYEHVLVYWVAPFTGSILSDFIEDFIHGPEYRNKSQPVTEQPQSVKTARKKKTKKSKARKSSWDPAGASQGKNGTGVSPKRRKRKDTNNNSKRTTNVGV